MTRCFVIGPIGDQFAPLGSEGRGKYEQALEVYENVIHAACAQVGLEAIRADQIARSGEITEQVFRHLYEDEVVIADVSDGNPNVMYELGLRHTRDLLTIQIGEYGQLPFDITAIRTIEFSRSPRGLIDARNKLITALNVGLAEGSDPVTATKVWTSAGSTEHGSGFDSELIGIETEVDDVEPDGFLDLMASVEEGFPKMTSTVESIADLMTTMGSEAETSGREMDLLNAQQAPTSARLSAVARFAQRLEAHAAELDSLTTAFAADMDRVDGSINGILEFLSEHPDAVTGETDEFFDNVAALAGSAREGMEGANQFARTVRDLGAFSKALRRPAKKISAALDLMNQKTRLMDEWEAAVVRLRRRRRVDGDVEGSAGVASSA